MEWRQIIKNRPRAQAGAAMINLRHHLVQRASEAVRKSVVGAALVAALRATTRVAPTVRCRNSIFSHLLPPVPEYGQDGRVMSGVAAAPCGVTRLFLWSRNSLDGIFCRTHNKSVNWEVEFTDEFGIWWRSLSEGQQDAVAQSVGLLADLGPALGFPHSSKVNGSRYPQMRELRTQSRGRPLRTLYAFDPRRAAILLIGGDKTGDNRWYQKFVPVADRLYEKHSDELRREGKI